MLSRCIFCLTIRSAHVMVPSRTKGSTMAYELGRAIETFRRKAADALVELAMCADPDRRHYLLARANQAEAEATAMQRSVDAWEADVARAEAMWNVG